MFRKFLGAIAALAAFSVADTAQAATVTCSNITYTANTADQTTAVCASGNLNQSGDITFDSMTYTLGIGDNGNPASGSPLSWSTDPMSNEGGTGLLDWGITLSANWVGSVILELKQASTYSLFDVSASCNFVTNSCAGTWSTSGPGNASNDLSHTRAWLKTGEVSPVPLPAAGWMIIAGLFGLGALRRRAS